MLDNVPDSNDPADLKSLFDNRPELEYCTVGLVDLQGQLRGKCVSRAKVLSALEAGIAFDPLLQTADFDDSTHLVDGVLDDSAGFGDGVCCVIPGSRREIPWEPETRNIFLQLEFCDASQSVDPRCVLRSVLDRAAETGVRCLSSVELEFTVFSESSSTLWSKGFKNLVLAENSSTYEGVLRLGHWSDFFGGMLDLASSLKVPIEAIHWEQDPSFAEVAFRYQDALRMADDAAFFKTYSKIYAQRKGSLISYMAKWSEQAQGQSGHIHISLVDDEGAPLFYDPDHAEDCSENLLAFIGGMQRYLPELFLMLAPNSNSFKRFIPGQQAPVEANWGIENRTCAFRVVGNSPGSKRVEVRLAGADANPYLSHACVIAAGIRGIEERCKPTSPVSGNFYEQGDQSNGELRLPATLEDACSRLSKSEMAAEWFGKKFVDLYVNTRLSQAKKLQQSITDKELELYLELA